MGPPSTRAHRLSMRIDAHHHFWHYSADEYGWIEDGAIRRDFLPADLEPELAAAGIDATIAVQARQGEVETRWLLELAARHSFIAGVVGWVPLISPAVNKVIEDYAENPKLRGVRHVVQGEPDERFILRDDFNRGVALLKGFNLRYDLLIYERHLPPTIEFVDRHPGQTFVVDHVAKPKIKAGEIEPWAGRIRELARRANVYCKVSGMVTEADVRHWTPEQLRPYFDVVLEAFGPRRLMFGSDWPVCLMGVRYGDWVRTVEAWTAGLSETEREWFFGRTAVEAYALEDPTTSA